jgi:RNA polymerase sigma factor (sigma-70 family)
MDSKNTRGTTIITKTTDGELFALMVKQGDAGEEAWAEFYIRYVGDLYKRVCRLRGIPQASVAGLVQETMLKAYDEAKSYKSIDASNARVASYTLAWLSSIARNEYRDMLRKQRGVLVGSLPQQDSEDDSQLSTKGRRISRGELHHEIKDAEDVIYGSSNEEPISLHRRLLREALGTLTEREQSIVVVTFDYHERGQKQQRLSNAAVKELREMYNISSANVRQIRRRAIEKIERYVTAHMPTKE